MMVNNNEHPKIPMNHPYSCKNADNNKMNKIYNKPSSKPNSHRGPRQNVFDFNQIDSNHSKTSLEDDFESNYGMINNNIDSNSKFNYSNRSQTNNNNQIYQPNFIQPIPVPKQSIDNPYYNSTSSSSKSKGNNSTQNNTFDNGILNINQINPSNNQTPISNRSIKNMNNNQNNSKDNEIFKSTSQFKNDADLHNISTISANNMFKNNNNNNNNNNM